MPRPKTKDELIKASDENFSKLFDLIGSFSESEITEGKFPFEDRDKNIRDVITHLYHWHKMFLEWYKVGMSGQKPDMPAKGYTWKTLPALNLRIWEEYQTTDYYTGVKNLRATHMKVMAIIEGHSDEELFTKKRYGWTGSTSLASYTISATSSHYDWAIKKIRKYKKSL